MEKVIDLTAAQQKAGELLKQYEIWCKEQPRDSEDVSFGEWAEDVSFGEWVLTTHYPNINYMFNDNLQRMVAENRTIDAKAQLINLFRDGSLPL